MPRRSATAARAAAAALGAPAVHVERDNARTVIVGCKLGIPRYELQLCREAIVTENTQTGPRQIKQFYKTGEVYVVRGCAYPEGTVPRGFIARPEMVDGYALTYDIPAEFWREWVKQNEKADIVKNRLIVAFEDRADLKDFAADFTGIRCAMSPLDMPMREGEKVDGRVPRSANTGVGNIERLSTAGT